MERGAACGSIRGTSVVRRRPRSTPPAEGCSALVHRDGHESGGRAKCQDVVVAALFARCSKVGNHIRVRRTAGINLQEVNDGLGGRLIGVAEGHANSARKKVALDCTVLW